MATGKTTFLVGVDLGGTKILTGVFTPGLECIGQMKISTKPERGPERVIERISRAIREAVDECDLTLDRIRGVGIGAPGAVNTKDGTVLFAPNLDWKNVALRKMLEKDLGIPVFIENDCKLNALGVYQAELDGKPRSMIGVFLGTGIGAGIFIEGRPYLGFNGTAGEIGHMVIDINGPLCGCGNHGCFEALASRRAIFRNIQTAVKKGQATVLTEMLGPDLADLRSGDLRKAIRRGDRFVERIIEQAAQYTGIAVGNLINLFNPEVIVLGGGIIEQLEHEMMSTIEQVARKQALAGTDKGIQIIASRLGDNAGITGGAVLVLRSLK